MIRFKTSALLGLILLTEHTNLVRAGQLPSNAQTVQSLPTVVVVGDAQQLPDLPGSAHVLGKSELEDSKVFTVSEALRKAPGVQVRDEEGFGLRPNIAIRGLNPTRSTKITLLEDGIPLAYAPYGDNASYYHPMVDRYERIEVLKGASSLLFGPQTIGGVINYITPNPRQKPGGSVQTSIGNLGLFNTRISAGGNGLSLDYIHKAGEGARENTSHRLDDFSLKYTKAFNRRHSITFKANAYHEDSVVTYSGLTQAEFERQGPRYNPFLNDQFVIDRAGVSLIHDWLLRPNLLLTTNMYYAQFDRDWWRQSSNSQDAQCGAVFNAARLSGDRVDPNTCNSTQGRLRYYETWGIEPRLTVNHDLGEFQMGIKAHFEDQSRQQINGPSPLARSGLLLENNLRQTTAYSAFISNRFNLGSFSITPLARYESIQANRLNLLGGASGSTTISEFTPGVGATWNASPSTTWFTSLYEGFAPPRVEDLIGGAGTVTEVDPERSINFEFGVRTQLAILGSLQASYFRNNFSNLIAVGSIAGGNTPLSQGRAFFEGLELAVNTDWSKSLFSRLAYTWLPVADQTTAFKNVASGGLVGVQGNRQPYAPEHTLTAAFGYKAGAVKAEVEAQHVGSQFSDFANTASPAANGQTGLLSAYTVWNATFNQQLQPKLSTFIAAKNLFDSTYIVDRSRGILVGMPRLVQVGFRYSF